ncbi:MAG TPA: 4-alpha-glucanotransferase [Gemmatimonadota bacterium]
MTSRPRLRELADRVGILPSYVAVGGERREASDATRVALLAAMRIDASSEASAAAALARLDRERAERLLPAAVVIRASAAAPSLRVHVPPAASGAVRWRVEVVTEDGDRRVSEGGADPSALEVARAHGGALALEPPAGLPPGWHAAHATLAWTGGEAAADAALVAVPDACLSPAELLGGRRAGGLWANLWSVRGRRSWGAGDLTDLAELARWAGREGLDFVGVNPLHALRAWAGEASPYSPVSRLFRNPLYLDVEAVPELVDSAAARARIASPGHRAALARLRAAPRLDPAAVAELQRPVIERLHEEFARRHRDRPTPRGEAYAAFRAGAGASLDDFATFLALEEALAAGGLGPGRWREWPAALRDARSPQVAAFRRSQPERVDVHRWIQFELDRQLAAAARAGRDAGLGVGLYGDLAIGSAGGGSDAWAFTEVFLEGASVGAPPDDFAPGGQDWGLPPVDPGGLARTGYRYWRELLRSAFAHAGALRIDHVMGLVRQFWIPAGRPGSEGAYVRYPADAMLGILALESRRHRALVIGEDLGTVPEGFRAELGRRGVLSSQVLPFETDPSGEFRPSRSWSAHALATANTHDLPPLEGFWEGRDLVLRRDAGQIAPGDAFRDAALRRWREREALARRLAEEGCIPAAGALPPDGAWPDLAAAVHAFLAKTPAPLVGAALDDLAGETDPVNLPGVGPDRHPSWTRRMRRPLAELQADRAVARTLTGLDALRRRRGAGP